MNGKTQWRNSRRVLERIFITGELILKTPACFGSGDSEGTTDIPLLFDSLDEKRPLLAGTSIAGALRNYLRQYEKGNFWGEDRNKSEKSLAERLFGCLDDAYLGEDKKAKKTAVESWLMVDDSLGTIPSKHPTTEIRDGVAIDPRTRTVEEDERGGHKFDFELIPAGTKFELSFELWKAEGEEDLLTALAVALNGLQDGEIRLGMRKRRGFGECKISKWTIWRYSMDRKEGLLNWLKHDKTGGQTGSSIKILLGADDQPDQRQSFHIDAQFKLLGSLLIRSEGEQDDPADMTHLKTWREDANSDQSILSGTSLAGVIRSRALRIANTMIGRKNGRRLVDEMFGQRISSHLDNPSASQLIVSETVIDNVVDNMVQNRVKIDRFTGGAYPQALFSQKSLWPMDGQKQVRVKLELQKPFDCSEQDFQAKIGLLLLVLKDLWMGDLPLGGESSVGRGRLGGVEAELLYGKQSKWQIQQGEKNLELVTGEKDGLETFVQAFLKWKTVPKNEGRASS